MAAFLNAPQALAATGAACVAAYLINNACSAINNSNPRIIKAFSGTMPPELDAAPAEAGDRLQRRPSWAAKFEAPEVPEGLRQEADAAANSRMQRRSSWAAKFEAPEVPEGLQAEMDAAATSRLQRRPSWSEKFERGTVEVKQTRLAQPRNSNGPAPLMSP